MSQLFVSETARALDVGDRIAEKLKEIERAELLEKLIDAHGAERPSVAIFGALLSDEQLDEIRSFLMRAEDALEPGESVRRLSARVDAIPREGIAWAWKPDAREPVVQAGSLTLGLTAGIEADARVLPGPRYEFKGSFRRRADGIAARSSGLESPRLGEPARRPRNRSRRAIPRPRASARGQARRGSGAGA